jgi:hypothetical protein
VHEQRRVTAVVDDERRPEPSGQSNASVVHHQYSSSVSPFQANTGMPFGAATVPPVSGRPTTTAAAA